MKILKVKVKREKYSNRTHYVYPPEYDATKISILCLESVGEESNVRLRDGANGKKFKKMNDHIKKMQQYVEGYEYMIGVVEDASAPQFLKSKDIVEITKTQANTAGRKWRPQQVKIHSVPKVLSILAKSVRGLEPLTQKEKNAIDPDHPEKGVGKSKLFDDLLAEYV